MAEVGTYIPFTRHYAESDETWAMDTRTGQLWHYSHNSHSNDKWEKNGREINKI